MFKKIILSLLCSFGLAQIIIKQNPLESIGWIIIGIFFTFLFALIWDSKI